MSADRSARVVALHVTHAGRAPLTPKDSVHALLDRGLEGDRHARPGSHRQVLLMEQEVLDLLALRPGDVREQVTVKDLGLDDLAAGTRLRIGSALLEVAGPCEPCERMEEIRPGLRDELEGRRGRFVRVIADGTFAVGDAIRIEPA